jgi:hypothetical protein
LISRTADFQSLPHDPVEVVTSIAGESQVPTVTGAEINTCGTVGVDDAAIAMLEVGKKTVKSLAGRIVLAMTVTMLATSTSWEAEADREILTDEAVNQRHVASVLPTKLNNSAQL